MSISVFSKPVSRKTSIAEQQQQQIPRSI